MAANAVLDADARLLGWHLRNAAAHPLNPKIRAILAEKAETLGIGKTALLPPARRPARRRLAMRHDARPEQRDGWAAFANGLERFHRPGGDVARNLRFLTAELGLDAVEAAIVELTLRHRRADELQSLADALAVRLGVEDAIATLIGKPAGAVRRALADDGRLLSAGVFTVERDSAFLGDFLVMTPGLRRTMTRPHRDARNWRSSLFGAPLQTRLQWPDYDHVARERDLCRAVLKGAAEGRERGVNILVHGPVGTGKTELCKLLAREIGRDVFAVGEAAGDGAGRAPTRDERAGALRLAQNLLPRNGRAILLFDEMEDLVAPADEAPSKVWLNRLLENNPVPTLWTANDREALGPALLRRMTAAVELKVPTPRARERIWAQALADNRIDGGGQARRLAADLPVSPALAANAARAARLAGGGVEMARTAAQGLARVLHGAAPIAENDSSLYDPELIRCREADPGFIAERLAKAGWAPWSIFVEGPPGAGKTAWVAHVARRLDVDLLRKDASDLLSKWVGDSERAIARAFEEAADTRALLLFDEIDGLLADRRNVDARWQAGLANELLVRMERTRGPFAASTNLGDRVDPAAARRFTFKLMFEHLAPAQIDLAFRRFFNQPCPEALLRLDALTPGDFAVARKKLAILGETDADAIQRALVAESERKSIRGRRIGF